MAESTYVVKPGGTLVGRLRVPGDKSVSHRAIMLGSLAEGVTDVTGYLEGEDCLATLAAFRAMGVEVESAGERRLVIHGVGLRGLSPPEQPLHLGNSGTSMRLLSGLLTGQSFPTVLLGDESLNRRPMRRITEPLRRMGAIIETSPTGTAPLRIGVASRLCGIDYSVPVASAQVKSCLLLAGLYAAGQTCIIEPAATRDHTERMLKAFGYPVGEQGQRICLTGGGRLKACSIEVPADISSAAFFLVGASIAPEADLLLEGVGVNPTRTGVIEILRLMGADIALSGLRWAGGEPVADIRVRSARLRGISVPQALVPSAIDEFPALLVAAACAEGETVLTGAAELRVKESDRIQMMADGLEALGVNARTLPDGIVVRGGSGFSGGEVDSGGDHRVAMAFTMAALRAEGELRIEDCANVATSFPDFAMRAQSAGLSLAERRPSLP